MPLMTISISFRFQSDSNTFQPTYFLRRFVFCGWAKWNCVQLCSFWTNTCFLSSWPGSSVMSTVLSSNKYDWARDDSAWTFLNECTACRQRKTEKVEKKDISVCFSAIDPISVESSTELIPSGHWLLLSAFLLSDHHPHRSFHPMCLYLSVRIDWFQLEKSILKNVHNYLKILICHMTSIIGRDQSQISGSVKRSIGLK